MSLEEGLNLKETAETANRESLIRSNKLEQNSHLSQWYSVLRCASQEHCWHKALTPLDLMLEHY